MKSLVKQLAKVRLTLIMGLSALLIAALPALGNLLQLDRAALAAGDLWRLATCHLTHWNVEHLIWDLLMFIVLGAACELRNPQRMRCCVATAAAAVTVLVLLCFPEIETYRGLSGIDTALFVLLAVEIVRDALRDGNRLLTLAAGGLLVGFMAKTIYEATTRQTIFVDQAAAGFVPLVWDHLVAGGIGAIAAFWPVRLRPALSAMAHV
jgi:rhomboid family GlyGly-CTERM serine protease